MDIETQIKLIRKQYVDEVSGLVTEIDERDNMRSAGRDEHYYSVGRNALHNVVLSMIESDVTQCRAFLDFPSGFGRVTRYMRAAFPEANIHVGDIWKEATTWAAEKFNATIIEANPDFSARMAHRYEVIFCGSLITHIAADQGTRLLDFFTAHLAVGGIAIVSTSGKKNLAHEATRFNEAVFGTPEKLAALTEAYFRGEYAYCDYPWQAGYGRSFIPVSWFHEYAAKKPEIVLTRFSERAWDDNQDIVVFKRIA